MVFVSNSEAVIIEDGSFAITLKSACILLNFTIGAGNSLVVRRSVRCRQMHQLCCFGGNKNKTTIRCHFFPNDCEKSSAPIDLLPSDLLDNERHICIAINFFARTALEVVKKRGYVFTAWMAPAFMQAKMR